MNIGVLTPFLHSYIPLRELLFQLSVVKNEFQNQQSHPCLFRRDLTSVLLCWKGVITSSGFYSSRNMHTGQSLENQLHNCISLKTIKPGLWFCSLLRWSQTHGLLEAWILNVRWSVNPKISARTLARKHKTSTLTLHGGHIKHFLLIWTGFGSLPLFCFAAWFLSFLIGLFPHVPPHLCLSLNPRNRN